MSKLIWQIFKYGVIGVVATAINLAVAELCAAYVWPCLGPNDLFVKHCGFAPSDVTDAVRATLAVYCNLVGFFVANIVCWLLNRKYVFTPGRHFWFVEWLLFLAGSGFAIACGSAVIWVLVRYHGMQTTYSFMVNVFVSVMVNFVVRKFFVFKG
ncbi:MAG: GtrA family protein [Kiritimatiellae bacterium]|nr:GtrA family protein [Kiritimatiellia bacterium]